MIKIMFVCHGNICRSPMAEFILKDMASKENLSGLLEIASSATSTEELGNSVYPPAKAELANHGIGCAGKYAVQLTKSDYEKYDLFIGMDGANIRNMHRIFGADSQNKIRRFMDYTGRGGDVSDPWYSGRFDITYRDIYDGCTQIIKIIKSGKKA